MARHRGKKTSDAILVGCVQSKLDHPAPAAELFVSPLFRARREHAERSNRPWFVVSSHYGLLRPEQVVAPYHLPQARRSVEARRTWGQLVVVQLEAALGELTGLALEIHAGSAYVDPIEVHARGRGVTFVTPLRGLTLGQHLAWYATRPRAAAPR